MVPGSRLAAHSWKQGYQAALGGGQAESTLVGMQREQQISSRSRMLTSTRRAPIRVAWGLSSSSSYAYPFCRSSDSINCDSSDAIAEIAVYTGMGNTRGIRAAWDKSDSVFGAATRVWRNR